MNKNDKKSSEIRVWVRLPETKLTLRMQKDMQEWKSQSAYFMHIITTYYNLTKK